MPLRTEAEIVARMHAKREEFLSFEPEVLICWISLDAAKPFLKEDAIEKNGGEEQYAKEWAEASKPYTREAVLAEAEEYMGRIGWDKVINHRGISASRTIQKMEAWVWLAGDIEVLQELEVRPYENYGAPKLKYLCEHYGWSIPDDSDVELMARGERCSACAAGDELGCGD